MEKALDVSDLSESDRGKSVKRQRFVTQRYSSFFRTGLLKEHKSDNADTDSDSVTDVGLKTPTITNLKISG